MKYHLVKRCHFIKNIEIYFTGILLLWCRSEVTDIIVIIVIYVQRKSVCMLGSLEVGDTPRVRASTTSRSPSTSSGTRPSHTAMDSINYYFKAAQPRKDNSGPSYLLQAFYVVQGKFW